MSESILAAVKNKYSQTAGSGLSSDQVGMRGRRGAGLNTYAKVENKSPATRRRKVSNPAGGRSLPIAGRCGAGEGKSADARAHDG